MQRLLMELLADVHHGLLTQIIETNLDWKVMLFAGGLIEIFIYPIVLISRISQSSESTYILEDAFRSKKVLRSDLKVLFMKKEPRGNG